jgi:AAA+ ATPase superfamily predicted ATPase
MLELLAEETGGFLYGAQQQTEAQNLADFGTALARFTGASAPLAFADWRQALDALFRLRTGDSPPLTVVIDEFPYLVATTPSLPSILQLALSPRGFANRESRVRLILCGSALTTMRGLLSGGAPLRGRALMELVVRPFWYREAADFWGLADDPELAFRVNALVGGTPAYRDMCGGAPTSRQAFNRWVASSVLSPSSAMFREGNLMLREEPALADPTPYAGVLSAVSHGRARRSEIAATIGRPATAIDHLLAGLDEIGLLARVEDAFKQRRGMYRIADPLIRLHQLVVARHEALLVRREAARVWSEVEDTVVSRIYGPHFEDLAREWVLAHASTSTVGGQADWVRPATLSCREHREGHELDVVAMRSAPFEPDRVLAIGEAKAISKPVGVGNLQRLEHLRDLLPDARVIEPPRLLLFGRAGFSTALTAASAGRSDVELVDLDRMYRGD